MQVVCDEVAGPRSADHPGTHRAARCSGTAQGAHEVGTPLVPRTPCAIGEVLLLVKDRAHDGETFRLPVACHGLGLSTGREEEEARPIRLGIDPHARPLGIC